jgi:hypothetical protein
MESAWGGFPAAKNIDPSVRVLAEGSVHVAIYREIHVRHARVSLEGVTVR